MALEWADRERPRQRHRARLDRNRLHGGLFASRHGEGLLGDIPMGRFATPEDVDGAAVCLASDATRYVTGSIVVVDGGRQLR